MTHGSLFSGIGGFDLAAQWMGWTNVFSCEIDEWCRKVLAKRFPEATQHNDITKTDFTIYRGRIDILTGGFPCQPYSQAGKRLGKEDDRHLWPEMLRAIREIQPGNVVGENVRGITNWNGGLVFDEVQADLETAGYEVLPFLLPACAVNAPHRRDRIWFIANRKGTGLYDGPQINQRKKYEQERNDLRNDISTDGNPKIITHPNSNGFNRGDSEHEINTGNEGLQGCENYRGIKQIRENGEKQPERLLPSDWEKFPTQSPICGGDDGIPYRVDRIKGLGNAIVPQIALQIFKAIEQTNNQLFSTPLNKG